MNLTKTLVTVLIVFIGLFVVPRLFNGKPGSEGSYGEFVTRQMPLIKSTIEEVLTSTTGACVRGDSYWIPDDAKVTSPFVGSDADYLPRRCDRCDDLTAAGLLTKKVTETGSDFGTTGEARPVEVSFTLTPLGRELYSEDIRPGSRPGEKQLVRWQFCLGKVRLYRIDKALNPFRLGGNQYVRVTFTPYVENPHPLLFDPVSKPLRLQVPKSRTPALLEPIETSIEFYPSGGAPGYRPDVR